MAASKVQRELAFLLTGKDVSASKAMRGVKKEVETLGGIGKKAGTNLVRNMERAFLLTGTAAVGAFGYSVKAAADFESQLNTINTIALETPEALGRIGDGIREIARETGQPLDDLTAGYYDLLSAGIDAADAQGVLRQATTLAIGGLSTNAEAVDLLTTAINTYGGDASRATQFTDEFAKAIERGKVTASEIAASYASVGPLAAQLGIENRELAAGYARLTAGGTAAGEASTQMAAALTALIKKTSGMKKLEKQTGKNYAAIAGSKGLAVAMQELRDDSDDAGVSITDLLGRKEALLYLLQVTGPNLEAYNADLAAMGDSAGTASRQMSERQKGLNHQVALLRANLHDAAITIGSEVIPELAALASEGVGWLQSHQPEIRAFAKDLAAGIREAVKWARSLDWESIGNSLKLAGQGAMTVANMFMGLPDWVKTAVLTGWGLNKLTGGAVFDLGKLVLTGLRGATPATPMYVAVVGGLPGVAGGAPGGVAAAGGGLAATLKSAVALGFAGLAVGGAIVVQQGMSEQSSRIAAEVRATGERYITDNRLSTAQLEQAIGAVDQGIAQIQSNPLNVLVQGSALDELRATRARFEQELEVMRQAERHAYVSTSHGQAMVDQQRRALEAQRAGERSITTGLDDAKRKTEAGTAAAARHADRLATKSEEEQQAIAAAKAVAVAQGVADAVRHGVAITAGWSQAMAIVGAIQRIPQPVVRISSTTVQQSSARADRYGSRSGSRNTGRRAF